MKFKYIDCVKPNTLIQNFYELQINQEDLPLITSVIPSAVTHIIHVDTNSPIEITINNEVFHNQGTIVLGQTYKAYKMVSNAPYYNFGINLHPTALYKLTGLDVSQLSNKHLNLSKVCKKLNQLLHPLFIKKYSAITLAKLVESKISNLPFIEDKNTKIIDEAVELIYKRKGIITVDEVLNESQISQKNLQIQFKKMVGLTPIKFIKLYKFISMMKHYERETLSVSKLIEIYNYYDLSHFAKDFKLFMNQKPSEYFKNDNEFLNNYLKK